MQTKRIYLLDCLRFVAVTLAIMSHVVLGFELYDIDDGAGLIGKMLTRTATPTLLILFGLMIEIAHAKRYAVDPQGAFARAVTRSMDCVFALLLAAAFTFLLTFDWRALANFLVLQRGYSTFSVLRLYAILMLAIPVLLYFRQRWGVWTYVGVLVLIKAYDFATDGVTCPDILNGYGALLGIDPSWGPGAIHSLGLVVFGMALGAFMQRRERGAGIFVGALIVLSAVVVFAAVRREGGEAFMEGMANLTRYRGHNDPEYFAFGILAFLGVIAFSWLLSLVRTPVVMAMVGKVGAHTLTYFVLGNFVIFVFQRFVHAKGAGEGVALTLTIFAMTIAGVFVWIRVHRARIRPDRREGAPVPGAQQAGLI